MTTQNTNSETQHTQEIPSISPAPEHVYDVELVEGFLDMVFEKAEDGEEILTWMQRSNIPGLPISDKTLSKKMPRVRLANCLYFGTSTTMKDPSDDRLYNRKALFKRYYVLVLDDVGTKVPLDRIPEEFKPTYIIESSPGNFQYGYVFEDPIDVLEQAEALLQIVYDAELSDGGGRMVTKLVRLPDGINGKKGPKGAFQVRLVHMDGPKWTPKRMLEVLDLGLTWDEVVKDTTLVAKRRANISCGTTPWSPITPQSPNLDGTVDPVLEWLYDEEMVKQETNEWLTIQCPWADEHSDDGDDTAGYSPMGRGTGVYKHTRGFNCFHDHCRTRNASDFLAHVAAADGPECAVSDQAADLLARYAYDPITDSAWEVKTPRKPTRIPMTGFRNLHPKKSLVWQADGKVQKIPDTTLWLTAPNRLEVWGATCDPSTEEKMVKVDDNFYINTFIKPHWGTGPYDQKEVNRFLDFITYLIPAETSSKYFLDWLAAKAQNMAFRGAAIVMVAKQQGTGRTTLADMIRELFLPQNVETVPFDTVVGSGTFNEWMTSPFIVSNETLATADTSNQYKAYERLKEVVDFRPIESRINPKYGVQRVEKVYSSFLFFSNHAGAIAAASNDRRLYVLSNPIKPASPEYFTKLNEWLAEGEWKRHVWRWLQEREVDITAMTAPAPSTSTKVEMLMVGHSRIDRAVDTVLEHWPSTVITTRVIKDIVMPMSHMFTDASHHKAERMLMQIIQQKTVSPHASIRKRICGNPPAEIRMIMERLNFAEARLCESGTKHQLEKLLVMEKQLADKADIPAITERVRAELSVD